MLEFQILSFCKLCVSGQYKLPPKDHVRDMECTKITSIETALELKQWYTIPGG